MLIKEASAKWNISERRIRKLIQDERIEGAVKYGGIWNIPNDASKPIDMRTNNNIKFIINIDPDRLYELDKKLHIINYERLLSKESLKSIKKAINLEWTYNSNGIEGNTLTMKETKIVLEGITIGGKTIKEHLEVINHDKALDYLEELIHTDNPITEWNIKTLHQLILKGIDDENAGRYRNENVIISGAKHKPSDYMIVPEEMENLIINYNNWNNNHPIIKAALLHGELIKIHPFIDGNGRTSRLLMNLELMSNDYLPIIIKKENKLYYYEALDKAHTTLDYSDFVSLLIDLEMEIIDRYIELIK